MTVLKNDHTENPCVWCGVRDLAQLLKQFQRTLPHASHTAHTLLHVADHPKACATPTNSIVHVLVQRLLRCMRSIHCKHVHLLYGCDTGPCVILVIA